MSERLDSEVDANAGEYIEDDPPAWDAFVEAVRRYHDYLPSLVERFGDDAFGIVAGSMIGFMADRHKVYVGLDRPGNRANGTRDWHEMPFGLSGAISRHKIGTIKGCPCWSWT